MKQKQLESWAYSKPAVTINLLTQSHCCRQAPSSTEDTAKARG
ncbi:hypothetical protein [Hoylesella enoeca]|nr:hypothetical protein [Hoylesella enoeca]